MPMIIKKDWLTIGEVSDLTNVPIHTLRYWESEFGGYFSPLRTNGRQRRYNEEAVSRVLEIKTLLKEEKYSIAGAKQVLSRKTSELPLPVEFGLPERMPEEPFLPAVLEPTIN
ncbi:MAG: MerR family transcriptional regulator [Deltaproteobacteria bacterium]|jgi:DNA-binding transcriptional MerR regulator|nr:MerR family transcriptional regulator [Deltaproteobacteria bacterium]